MAKIITWRGMTQEQVAALDIEAFKALISSRARRSLERGYTPVQQKVVDQLAAGKDNIKTHCRDLVIMPMMLGKTIKVYTGKSFEPVSVTLEMLGHRLGEFASSRKLVSHGSAGVGATKSGKAVSAR